eukprot:TRINITY_DN64479_c1_g1_i1.p4 TRINITY_DN64479_c1_g1~~TRINITY_DN64479_c1_g1_i1.p4  ORF type:complete len:193 (-),score=23.78 TRINITY_DN64479_c1_g1_i1:2160-2738(-)
MSETKMEGPVRIQWSGELKGIFAAKTKNGATNVYSYHDAINPGLVRGKKQPEVIPPAWLKRTAGSAFGYGGKLVTFNQSKLTIQKITEDKEIAKSIRAFDKLLNQASLSEICSLKAEENSGDEHEKTEWLFMRALAAGKKELILNALGFEPATYFASYKIIVHQKKLRCILARKSLSPVKLTKKVALHCPQK